MCHGVRVAADGGDDADDDTSDSANLAPFVLPLLSVSSILWCCSLCQKQKKSRIVCHRLAHNGNVCWVFGVGGIGGPRQTNNT